MIGLDTNVLLRGLIGESVWPDDNPGRTQRVADLILDSGETFFVNNVVLAETVWVLAHAMA